MLDNPISEEDLDFIDAILEKYDTEHAIVSVSELDGFLTAIVSGPDMILPSEWLPEIWGGEDLAPAWESQEEVSRFIGIAIGIMNGNSDTLMESPEAFEAMFLMDMVDEESVEIVSLWCHGYMRGVALREQSWARLPESLQAHLNAIARFTTGIDEVDPDPLVGEQIDNLKSQIAPAARALHAYWLTQRAHLAPGRIPVGRLGPFGAPPQGQVLPFVREQPKIGPNQPCPCGSGKKYKKCCGGH